MHHQSISTICFWIWYLDKTDLFEDCVFHPRSSYLNSEFRNGANQKKTCLNYTTFFLLMQLFCLSQHFIWLWQFSNLIAFENCVSESHDERKRHKVINNTYFSLNMLIKKFCLSTWHVNQNMMKKRVTFVLKLNRFCCCCFASP